MIYREYVEELHRKVEDGLEVIFSMQGIIDTQSEEIQRLQRRIMELEPCDKTALELLGDEPVFTHELQLGGVVTTDDIRPPEKRSEVASSKKRVKKAEKLFNDHFDPSGNPKTIKGEKLSAKYAY
jgi:hypothetical protein